jgi:hypothetical protein
LNGYWQKGFSELCGVHGLHSSTTISVGLWKGVGPNLMLVSNPTIHFFVYERVRIVMASTAQKRGTPLNSLEFFIMGAIAKAAATVFTYPIQVLRFNPVLGCLFINIVGNISGCAIPIAK